MSVSVSVDPDNCVASGLCKRLAPQVFELESDSDTSTVVTPTLTDSALIALAREAADACPTGAITVA